MELSHDNVVILYSASWCSWCYKTKEFFVDNEINYIEKDIEDPDNVSSLVKFAKSTGYSGILDVVPLSIVKGQIIVGYQPVKILKILGRNKGIIKIFVKDKNYNNLRRNKIFRY